MFKALGRYYDIKRPANVLVYPRHDIDISATHDIDPEICAAGE
jgi:hypothetical protein